MTAAMRMSLSAALVAVPLLAWPLTAQDTRTVREPVVPSACATLDAALVPQGDTTVSEADEGRLDSPRIQQALDRCTSGQAVVLKTSGTRRAFVSGPLQLRAGVTLVLERGVVLFASRQASVCAPRGTSGGGSGHGPRSA